MTKKDLYDALTVFKPEILFASHNGRHMFLNVDIENKRLTWSVFYSDGYDGYYTQFDDDFDKACNFLLTYNTCLDDSFEAQKETARAIANGLLDKEI